MLKTTIETQLKVRKKKVSFSIGFVDHFLRPERLRHHKYVEHTALAK
jgi:hypothetical protein